MGLFDKVFGKKDVQKTAYDMYGELKESGIHYFIDYHLAYRMEKWAACKAEVKQTQDMDEQLQIIETSLDEIHSFFGEPAEASKEGRFFYEKYRDWKMFYLRYLLAVKERSMVGITKTSQALTLLKLADIVATASMRSKHVTPARSTVIFVPQKTPMDGRPGPSAFYQSTYGEGKKGD